MKNYNALCRELVLSTCKDCAHFSTAGKVSDSFPDEVEATGLDEDTTVCGNFYSAHFLEEVDETDCCTSIETNFI